MTWQEVLEIHGSRRGIRVTKIHTSILLDFGLSVYHNRREAGVLFYEGEGKTGDQMPTHGNAGLLECLELQRPVLVLERLKPGLWCNAGIILWWISSISNSSSNNAMCLSFNCSSWNKFLADELAQNDRVLNFTIFSKQNNFGNHLGAARVTVGQW